MGRTRPLFGLIYFLFPFEIALHGAIAELRLITPEHRLPLMKNKHLNFRKNFLYINQVLFYLLSLKDPFIIL